MTTIGTLQRLRAEIRADRAILEERFQEIASVVLEDEPGRLAQMAVALHHLYGAVESIMTRLARTIEGSLPEGPDWHQVLLRDMGLEIEGIRPTVFCQQTLDHLRCLLAFRHFFRHAYATKLDVERLRSLQAIAASLCPLLDHDLDQLDGFLQSLVTCRSS